jgi:RND family efflux transporter MFP subunit
MTPKYRYLSIVALVVLCTVAFLMFKGKKASASTSETGPPPAAVALAVYRPLSQTLTLSGEFRPFQEVDVHAKVAGYLRQIYVDVGDHVKRGQVLAVLEIPELAAELQGTDATVRRSKDAVRRSQSDLNRAQSLHQAAHLDYTRLKQAGEARPGLIAQQELDDAEAKDKESEAQISSAEAALSEARNELDVSSATEKQYSAMSDYTRITAPFDGVVTRRYVDTGALVQAGTTSNTQALPVVSVAQNNLFRLVLPVPESAVPMIHLGTDISVHVQALDRDFDGKVARFADDLNEQTRTMHTEVDVPNKTGEIVPGMYAEVKLVLRSKNKALTVPVQSVIRDGSLAKLLIVDKENRVEQRTVQLGMETPDSIEIVSGLRDGERVLLGGQSELRPGEQVTPKIMEARQGSPEGQS